MGRFIANLAFLAAAATAFRADARAQLQEDFTPPRSITLEEVPGTATGSSLTLQWTAPTEGVDGLPRAGGAAAVYDLRYTTWNWIESRNAYWWNEGWETGTNMRQVEGEPTPTTPGVVQFMTVDGLSEGSTYVFAMTAADSEGNWNQVASTCTAITRSGDTTPPNPATDFRVLPGSEGESSVSLEFRVSGDDVVSGDVSAFELRFKTNQTYTGGTQDPFANNPAFYAEAFVMQATPSTPLPWPAGSIQRLELSGLGPDLLYFFALKLGDDAQPSNWSQVALTLQSYRTLLYSTDRTPPAGIADLAALQTAPAVFKVGGDLRGRAVLNFSAVGDDGMAGVAKKYSVRRSASPIEDEAAWGEAEIPGDVVMRVAPAVAGDPVELIVPDLDPETSYHFSVRGIDAPGGQLGPISNSASVRIDFVPPAATTLWATVDEISGTATLSWTAVGDNGMEGVAERYDVRVRIDGIIGGEGDFEASTPLEGAPTPVAPGLTQSMTVVGLPTGTDLGFAIKVFDEADGASPMSSVYVEKGSSGESGVSCGAAASGMALGPALILAAFIRRRNVARR